MTNDRQITISVGASRASTDWQPQTLTISEFYDRLRTPARGTETLAQYFAMQKSQQDRLKDAGGFVAGTRNGTRRKANAVTGRDVITLDLDNIPAGGTQDVLRRVEGLGCGYCVYSTRKHCPAAPRLRVLLPLDRTCTADEYEPIARKLAELIGLELADPTTFQAAGGQAAAVGGRRAGALFRLARSYRLAGCPRRCEPRPAGGQAGGPPGQDGRCGGLLPCLRH